MKTIWALQDAKNRLSEVVDHAIQEGPQTITRRGQETVIVLSVQDFKKLAVAAKDNLVTFFRQSPLVGMEWDVKRSGDYGREIEL